MSDPVRLRALQGSTSSGNMYSAADVLASAQGDAPSTNARNAAAAMLGLGAATTVVTISATTTAATSAGGAGALTAVPLAAAGNIGGGTLTLAGKVAAASVWVKAALAVTAVAAVAGGTAYVNSDATPLRGSAEAAPVHSTSSAAGLPAPAAPRIATSTAMPLDEIPLGTTPTAVNEGTLGAPSTPTPPATTAAAKARNPAPTPLQTPEPLHDALTTTPSEPNQVPSLSDELVEIERARASLATDAATSLAQARAYRAAHPHGSFAPEAQILEVDALTAVGQPAAAAREAAQYLDKYPEGPAAARFRRLAESKLPATKD